MPDHFLDVSVYITETTRGTFLAATNASPYFCVEAPTEDAAVNKAKGALQFYFANQSTPTPARPRDFQTTAFSTRRVISGRQLIAA